jgi:two-component system sensor histidine kinase KdpD
LIDARQCSIFLPDDAGRLRLYTAAPGSSQTTDAPAAAMRAYAAGVAVDEGDNVFLPLTVHNKVAGVLHVSAPPQEPRLPEAARRLMQILAGQIATVIERLRLQREAAEAEVLRKTDELKSALLSAVSHDLRTPLASIRIAATGLLQEDLRSNEDARRELLRMIDTEAARLARLVNNLLDLSRIEAGVLRPEKELCDLQEVVARAVDYLDDRLRGHRVVVDIPPDLPLVPLDFTEIEDVLANLLDNAIRHSPEGSTIHISATQRNREVLVLVENQGPPIPVEAAGQIFDRCYRAQRDRRGVGLGLAICKGLVEAHGGRIWVERPGEPGARFAFTLPMADAATPVAPPVRGT